MSTPKVYAICGTNCRYETLTKEQILTAIANAVENGDIGDIDTGFITTIKEQNGGEGLRFWVGTMAAYNALTEIDSDMLYIITDDTTLADIEQAYDEIKTALDDIEKGASIVPKAKVAQYASEDTSKGTIEERLTKLGFKEGAVSLSISTNGTPINIIKRQGNYCILDISLNPATSMSPLKLGTLPADFRPKETIYPRAQITRNDGSIVVGFCTITTDGIIMMDWDNSEVAFVFVLSNIGYEANPIA